MATHHQPTIPATSTSPSSLNANAAEFVPGNFSAPYFYTSFGARSSYPPPHQNHFSPTASSARPFSPSSASSCLTSSSSPVLTSSPRPPAVGHISAAAAAAASFSPPPHTLTSAYNLRSIHYYYY
eukprot:GHVS01071898.1.p1 GENE.GHVS01071898.1~~GHVS01071898.1.p1  ORF type:complete len:125 (-),score=32.51 GHVS01071898.1:93-467(-)